MTAPAIPHRFQVVYVWPLIGIAVIAALWLLIGLTARLLIPISATAHTILYGLYVFVELPLLLFMTPVLLLVQAALLVSLWRRRARPVA